MSFSETVMLDNDSISACDAGLPEAKCARSRQTVARRRLVRIFFLLLGPRHLDGIALWPLDDGVVAGGIVQRRGFVVADPHAFSKKRRRPSHRRHCSPPGGKGRSVPLDPLRKGACGSHSVVPLSSDLIRK